MPFDADVVIVGGGPAGAAAAIVAAKAGQRVVVFDKAQFPRDKCCGDGLTTGALRRLEVLGLRPEDVKSWQWVDDVRVRSCSGRVAHYPLPRGQAGHFGAVARRVDLDAALLDVARDAGAVVHEGALVTAVNDAGHEVVVTATGHGEIRAGHLIAADGMWSTTRKLLGTLPTPRPSSRWRHAGRSVADGPYLGEWHAYRQYFRDASISDLWVWFEPDLLPGYMWAFPLPGGGANVGFGVERQPGGPPTKFMKSLWPQLLARPHIAAVLGPNAKGEDSPKAWPIPAGISGAELARGRVLFAGDAARACDILTGEGIGQALQTGMAAAATLTNVDRAMNPAAEYTRLVRAELGPDHRMAALLQQAMRQPWVCRGAVRLSDANDWTRRNFGRWLFEDCPRGIALTPRRWRRGALTGAGSYTGR